MGRFRSTPVGCRRPQLLSSLFVSRLSTLQIRRATETPKHRKARQPLGEGFDCPPPSPRSVSAEALPTWLPDLSGCRCFGHPWNSLSAAHTLRTARRQLGDGSRPRHAAPTDVCPQPKPPPDGSWRFRFFGCSVYLLFRKVDGAYTSLDIVISLGFCTL